MKSNDSCFRIGIDIIIHGIVGWFIILVLMPYLFIARVEISKLFDQDDEFNI